MALSSTVPEEQGDYDCEEEQGAEDATNEGTLADT